MTTRDLWKIVAGALLFSPMLFAVSPLLAFLLVLYVMLNISRMRSALRRCAAFYQDSRAILRRYSVIIVLVCILLFVLGLYKYGEFVALSPRLLVFIQVASGNWSRDVSQSAELNSIIRIPFWAALYAALAVLLNVGPWVWLIVHIGSAISFKKEMTMKLSHAIAALRAMTMLALCAEFGTDHETVERIRRSVNQGEKNWRPQLVAMFGEDEANRLFGLLDSEVFRPSHPNVPPSTPSSSGPV